MNTVIVRWCRALCLVLWACAVCAFCLFVCIWVTWMRARGPQTAAAAKQGGGRSSRTRLVLGQIAPQPAVALADLSHSGRCQLEGRKPSHSLPRCHHITSHLPACSPARLLLALPKTFTRSSRQFVAFCTNQLVGHVAECSPLQSDYKY